MKAIPKTLAEWLTSGAYLPAPLRDFHDQKEVFKSIWQVVLLDESAAMWLQGMTWTSAQIFTIDQFLHFMAKHGWTLQRSRHRAHYHDLARTISDRREHEGIAFRRMLDESRPTSASPTGEP